METSDIESELSEPPSSKLQELEPEEKGEDSGVSVKLCKLQGVYD